MAASVFVVAFEATIRMLTCWLGIGCLVLACADDLLLLLPGIALLAKAERVFDVTRAATALRLAAAKCILVPLWQAFSLQTAALLRDGVVRWAPSFARSAIQPWTTFLGFPLGPGSTEEEAWKPIVNKMRARAYEISATGVFPTLAGTLFSARDTTTPGHMAQFIPPPRNVGKIETQLFSKLLNAPGNFHAAQRSCAFVRSISHDFSVTECSLLGHACTGHFQDAA